MGKHRLWRHSPSQTMETYGSWANMRYRCFDVGHPQFPEYGGRGITVCDSWADDYDAFYDDLGRRPAGMTLDRIDNDGNYTPENCRWATPLVQVSNTRKNKSLPQDISHKEISETSGINYSTYLGRKNRGFDPKIDQKVGNPRIAEHGTYSRYSSAKHRCRCDMCMQAMRIFNKLRNKVYDL